MKDLWSYYSKTIITVLLVVVTVGGLIYAGYNYYKHSEERLAKAITLTQEQALDIATLKQKLSISQQNAELLQGQIQRVVQGKVKPVATFTQQADTVEEAAVDVQKRINNNDETLPAAFLEKTDRTIVVPQKLDNKNYYEVGAYKINLKPKWEFGLGAGVLAGNAYGSVAVKNNYSKKHAVSIDLDSKFKDPKDMRIDGGKIMWWINP